MKIALATCAEKPTLTAGDQLLANELRHLGIETAPLVWTSHEPNDDTWDGVIVRSVWDYHLHAGEFLRFLEGLQRPTGASGRKVRLFNSLEIIKWNIDKRYLLELSERGVPCVPSILIPRSTQPSEVFANILRESWARNSAGIILKPTVSATAYLTARCSIGDIEISGQNSDQNNDQSSGQINGQINGQIVKIHEHSDLLVQPYLPSVETDGEVSLIFFNGRQSSFSHAIHKRPRRGDYRVQSDFGGEVAPIAASEALIEMALSALSVLEGTWIFARVDILNWRNDPMISEIELIEPDLFLQYTASAAGKLAEAIVAQLTA